MRLGTGGRDIGRGRVGREHTNILTLRDDRHSGRSEKSATNTVAAGRNDDLVAERPVRSNRIERYGSGAYPSATLRMDFRDPEIAGTFVFHCHVLDHEDAGMMAKIRVNPR
jgi:FtsP/CotA-like multicopper oxidase with cupredoxin domain